ncbi:MAG: crotonase/enoyl-CoA hydratase family protein [Thermoleophilaceae bacterium]|nr:crotonase/enoyl-CoA hydratase family protein [Thermoleophilaceae bacterium]
MSTEVLQYVVDQRVATIVHDDDRANTLRTDVFEAYFELLDRAEADEAVGAVVLRGRDNFFSAGMDLKWMTTIDREELGTIGPNMARLAHRLFVFPKPVIAAITGHAIAGGAIILLACDRSVGVEGEYKIGLNEVALGIPFGGFAMKLAQSHLVPSAFGSGLLHGETFRPARALELGYLDEVAPAAEFDARVAAIAARAAELSPFAYQLTKQAMRAELAAEIDEQIQSGVLVQLFQAFADLNNS